MPRDRALRGPPPPRSPPWQPTSARASTAAVRAGAPRGEQLLYVALTRAVTSLHILHGSPSPLGASDRYDL
ncbi:hypothetical protein [Streptomyces sp. NRRL F-5630]|uniref:hypothetical protein n=1 Tax=Streptomyces sp. NRRL F-5630 TaxID=1463864 RepID=UPI003D755E88